MSPHLAQTLIFIAAMAIAVPLLYRYFNRAIERDMEIIRNTDPDILRLRYAIARRNTPYYLPSMPDDSE